LLWQQHFCFLIAIDFCHEQIQTIGLLIFIMRAWLIRIIPVMPDISWTRHHH
jgi:hypothetical protein